MLDRPSQVISASIPMQDLYVALTDLRNSLRTASDESAVLTSPAWSFYKVIKALGDATSDLEVVREMVKKYWVHLRLFKLRVRVRMLYCTV